VSKHPAHLLGMAIQQLELIAIAPDLETAKRDAVGVLAAIRENLARADEPGAGRGRLALLGPVAVERRSFAAEVAEAQRADRRADRRLGRGLGDLIGSASVGNQSGTPPMGGSGVPGDGAAAPGGYSPAPAVAAIPSAAPSSLPAGASGGAA
jgi:hypothetical protein